MTLIINSFFISILFIRVSFVLFEDNDELKIFNLLLSSFYYLLSLSILL